MLSKVAHCTGCILANTRPNDLRWGDRQMGTAISWREYNQVASLIQKVGRGSSKALSLYTAVLCAGVLHLKITVIIIVTWYQGADVCICMCMPI